MKCKLELFEEHKYLEEFGVEPYPVVQVKIYRSELKYAINTQALVDTGFDEALILSRPLGDFITNYVEKPDGFEELDAAGLGIPCDTYILDIFIANRWFRVKAHLPQIGNLGTIIGRKILNKLYLCLRGKENKLYLAKPFV
ncbi:MAG: hypothetical protein ACTSXW_07205 [Candidatus Baldrarchaeia archaeon]